MISMDLSAVNRRRPSRETPLGLGAKKGGCFRRLLATLLKTRLIYSVYLFEREQGAYFFFEKQPNVQNTTNYRLTYSRSERISGIYLHEFTNNEREISISHEAAECGIENFSFIVSERVLVNPDNSRVISALTFLLFEIECTANKNRQTLSQPKPWCNDSGVLNLHHGYYTTIMT